MSSPSPTQRSSLYYCYQCHTEARPLMVPDPHCPSCNSTFVEEIPPNDTDSSSNPELDPRNFQVDPDTPLHSHDGHAHFDPPGDFYMGSGSPNPDPIITLMDMLMTRPLGRPSGRPGFGGMSGGGTALRFDMTNGQGRVMFTSGGGGAPLGGILPGPSFGSPGTGAHVPRGGMQSVPPGLEGIFALLGGMPMMGPGGRMGDYVLDQHALDEVVTQLMEQNQGSRPVPAPDDMLARLPRSKVMVGDLLTEKECAVCKDTFAPPGPNEDDVVAITLPCNDNPKYQHSFHEDCILPWLKENGTCPVCRFQLVPQPQPHGPPPEASGQERRSPGAVRSRGNVRHHSGSENLGESSMTSGLGGLWGMLMGHGANNSTSSHGNPNRQPTEAEVQALPTERRGSGSGAEEGLGSPSRNDGSPEPRTGERTRRPYGSSRYGSNNQGGSFPGAWGTQE